MKNKLSKNIEKFQSQITDSNVRDYIGASTIGSSCLRQIWYEYKGFPAEEVPFKIRRTWAIGKHLESLVIQWLRFSGFDIVTSYKPLESNCVSLFKGHIDAVLIKNGLATSIIEIKTAKNASYNIFVKKGIKAWNPQYYAQIQSYMGMSGIFNAYILVLNKDNSELSDELVTFDADFYKELENKALMISQAEHPPPKINSSPMWFECKMCKFNKVCHK